MICGDDIPTINIIFIANGQISGHTVHITHNLQYCKCENFLFSFFDTVSFLNADIPHFRSESSGRHAARWTVSGPLFCTHATQVGHQFRKPLNGCNGHRWWAADKGYVAPYPM